MRSDDFDAFVAVMQKHHAKWGRVYKTELAEAQFEFLERFSLDQIRDACDALREVQGKKHPGDPGEIRDEILARRADAGPAGEPRQCGYMAGQTQCLFVAYRPKNPGEPQGVWWCEEHQGCTDTQRGAAIVHRSVRDYGTFERIDYGLARDIENYLTTVADGQPGSPNLLQHANGQPRYPSLLQDGMSAGEAVARAVYPARAVNAVQLMLQHHGSVDAAYGYKPGPVVSRPSLPAGQHYADARTALDGVPA